MGDGWWEDPAAGHLHWWDIGAGLTSKAAGARSCEPRYSGRIA